MKIPKIKYYEVETCIANWDEISIEHPKLSIKFIKKLLPKFIELDFACDAYFANNGIFRICMLGNEKRFIPLLSKNIPDDITIHPKRGVCTIMRNCNSEIYKEREDKIVEIICEELSK